MKMKISYVKHVITVLLLLASGSEIFAKVRFGLGADIRYSILTNYEKGLQRYGSYKAENSLGITPGAYLEFTIGKRCLLETGLSYEYIKHTVEEASYYSGWPYVPYIIREYTALHYIQAPVIFKYKLFSFDKADINISTGLILKYLLAHGGRLQYLGDGPGSSLPCEPIGLAPTLGFNLRKALWKNKVGELGLAANYELIPFLFSNSTMEGTFRNARTLQIAVRTRIFF